MTRNAEDPEEQACLTAILQGLQERGWTDGRNVRIDIRWSAADPDRRLRYAAELVALRPGVIIADTRVAKIVKNPSKRSPEGRER
jgi:putative ABC transport system substrate-binding protein